MKKLVLGFCLFPFWLFAQSTQAELNRMRQEREAAMAQMRADYDQYKATRDREFANYLRKRWAEVEGQLHQSALRPKPKSVPLAPPPKPPTVNEPLNDKPKTTAPHQEVIINLPKADSLQTNKTLPTKHLGQKEPLGIVDSLLPGELVPDDADFLEVQPNLKPQPPKTDAILPVYKRTLTPDFDWQSGVKQTTFYGQSIEIPQWPSSFPNLRAPYTNRQIADWYGRISRNQTKDIVQYLLYIKDELQLNDWGYAELVNWYAGQISTNSWAQAQAITWYLMIQSGFDVRLVYNRNAIFLVSASSQQLFNRPFFKAKNQQSPYYILFGESQFKKGESYFIYENNIEIASKSIDFMVTQWHLLGRKESKEKTFYFNHNGKSLQVKFPVYDDSKRLTAYYPTADLQIFLNARASMETKAFIKTAFEPLLQNLSMLEKVNLLLSFAQTAFEYQTDDDQFKREKFMFPEEVLLYEASDCEDRSALFAFLVRHLLQTPVIGLVYDDHVSTAVLVNEPSIIDIGGIVNFKGKRYIHCDPTYIRAAAGRVMPQYQQVTPKIVEIKF